MCKCQLSHEFIHLGSVMTITHHQLMRLSGKLSLNLCLSVQGVKLLLMKLKNTLLSHRQFFCLFNSSFGNLSAFPSSNLPLNTMISDYKHMKNDSVTLWLFRWFYCLYRFIWKLQAITSHQNKMQTMNDMSGIFYVFRVLVYLWNSAVHHWRKNLTWEKKESALFLCSRPAQTLALFFPRWSNWLSGRAWVWSCQ